MPTVPPPLISGFQQIDFLSLWETTWRRNETSWATIISLLWEKVYCKLLSISQLGGPELSSTPSLQGTEVVFLCHKKLQNKGIINPVYNDSTQEQMERDDPVCQGKATGVLLPTRAPAGKPFPPLVITVMPRSGAALVPHTSPGSALSAVGWRRLPSAELYLCDEASSGLGTRGAQSACPLASKG